MRVSQPRLLQETDPIGEFSSGNRELDVWLKNRAWRNQKSGDSRTYLSIDTQENSIAGYYSLSARSVARDTASGALARNSPDPIPVILLGQLAVSESHRGIGLGASLFSDAIRRCQSAAEIIGARAVITEPIDESARQFYLHMLMRELSDNSNIMYLLLRINRYAND